MVVLELGAQYAAPFGATLLTDLGARVIKLEPLEGDQIRYMTSFPDLSGVKVMQGKESLAIDITSAEGLEIVYELVERADVVLQSFRAGVAERRGLSAADLQARNPTAGVRERARLRRSRSVRAPSRLRPDHRGRLRHSVAERVAGSFRKEPVSTWRTSRRRRCSCEPGAWERPTPTGTPPSASATGLLFGIYLRERGLGAQHLGTSMLLTTAHAMADDVVQYPGRPATAMADPELYGLNARYRLYPAAAGWVMLAVPTEPDWARLIRADEFSALKTDPRFASEQARTDHDETWPPNWRRSSKSGPPQQWEALLLPQGIPCVQVTETVSHEHMYNDEFGRASGYVTDVDHPTFGPHPRLTPLVRFSRSADPHRAGLHPRRAHRRHPLRARPQRRRDRGVAGQRCRRMRRDGRPFRSLALGHTNAVRQAIPTTLRSDKSAVTRRLPPRPHLFKIDVDALSGLLTEDLAHRVASLDAAAIAPADLERARQCLLDWLGAAIAGSSSAPALAVRAALDDIGGGPGPATIVGTRRRASALDAALANGSASHSMELDDVALGMGGHPSVSVCSAAVALAEVMGSSISELFVALVAGYDVACRLGIALGPSHGRGGWHATGTVGTFAATAACCRLLRPLPRPGGGGPRHRRLPGGGNQRRHRNHRQAAPRRQGRRGRRAHRPPGGRRRHRSRRWPGTLRRPHEHHLRSRAGDGDRWARRRGSGPSCSNAMRAAGSCSPR